MGISINVGCTSIYDNLIDPQCPFHPRPRLELHNRPRTTTPDPQADPSISHVNRFFAGNVQHHLILRCLLNKHGVTARASYHPERAIKGTSRIVGEYKPITPFPFVFLLTSRASHFLLP